MTKSTPALRWKSTVDPRMSASSRTSRVRTSTGRDRAGSHREACVERPYRLDDVADVVVGVSRRQREGEDLLARALRVRQLHRRPVELAAPAQAVDLPG